MVRRAGYPVTCVMAVLAMAWAARGQDAPPPATTPNEAPSAEPNPSPDPSPAPADDAAAQKTPEPSLTPTEVSADEVLREFQKERPRAEPLLPQPPGDESVVREAAEPSARPGFGGRMPDGYMLDDRVGRLVQDGPWWTIVFRSDNNPNVAPEPPLKLLPNQMLERAIRETQGGARSVEFVVAGEITAFMGDNYLLLRKLMRLRDLGNLSK